MRPHRFQILGSAEHGQQDGIRDKVEPGEGSPLVVEIAHQGLEADLQFFVDMAQHNSPRNLSAIARLEYK